MPEDRPPEVHHLDWRLTELEKKVDAGFATMRQDMRDQLTRLEGSVERLAFVDVKLYTSEQHAQDRSIADLAQAMAALEARQDKRMDRSDMRVNATLGLLIGAILSVLGAYLIHLATS